VHYHPGDDDDEHHHHHQKVKKAVGLGER